IKDNHLALVGCEGLPSLVDRIRTRHGIPIEIEVSAPEQLDQVIPLRPERILLDNMSVESLRHCVRAIRASGGSIYVEASGGIDLSNVRSVALTGVDGISVGRITHSAASADIAMDWGTGKT
ncbi:hypothetical protein JW921_02185, partial [Candidatus Fermentibacterales bacterium]|nr:hypothetical protein [Candidatus Fermentibacterales bacterium]